VGRYDADGIIEAEDFFNSSGIKKTENKDKGFSVSDIDDGDYISFPNTFGLKDKSILQLKALINKRVRVEIRHGSPEGEILASVKLKKNKGRWETHSIEIPPQNNDANLCFVFIGKKKDLLLIDSFTLSDQ